MSFSPVVVWLVLAFALAGLEMLSLSFYLLAISVGALSGAFAAWVGLAQNAQILCAALTALVATAALHRWKKKNAPKNKGYAMFDIDQRVQVLHWTSERRARVQYRGSQWDAELIPGARAGDMEYTIQEVNANTLQLNNIVSEKN